MHLFDAKGAKRDKGGRALTVREVWQWNPMFRHGRGVVDPWKLKAVVKAAGKSLHVCQRAVAPAPPGPPGTGGVGGGRGGVGGG